jgi:transcriptional regulator with XRE-family HTH domain
MNNGDFRHATPVGRYLGLLREWAGMTQGQLAQRVTLSTATISRIESGDKQATNDEITSILKQIGTPEAKELGDFLRQTWDCVDRPEFDHPDRAALWGANLALRKLAALRDDPEITGVFIRHIDVYRAEIERLVSFLASPAHQIACIGSIGVGKSTAICKLTGLLKPGEEKLDKQIVLETGAGGITLCEVHISQGPRYGLRIVPRTEDSIRRDVEDFCDYLFSIARPDASGATKGDEEDGDPLGISKEVVRAIRNMAGLTEKRREVDGKRVRIDPAKELAQQYSSAQELCIHILTRMDLLRRNRRDAWYPDGHADPPAHWLQQVFSDVNNGRHPEFTLPQKIEVIVPEPVFESRDLPIRIIDTKGIDQTAERPDLECHFDDPRTLVVLCSRFNDAPEVALQTLLRRAKEGRVRDIRETTMLLVLPRPDEALAEKHDDGTRVEDDEEGYELKADKIDLRLALQGMSGLPIGFFNARDEAPQTMRDRLVGMIVKNRRRYAEQIAHLSYAVDRLVENRANEEIRVVFDHVASDLGTWIEKNRELDLSDEGVQEPLITAIDGTRYASTVRAAVRRHGDWNNLDYYHHLAHGVRKLAANQIGSKIDSFKIIVGNLIDNDELAAAKEFLQQVVSRVDAAVDDAYRWLQVAGREAFKQTLEQDYEFWNKCEDRWGQGQGYRSAIRDMTDEQFEQNYDDAQKLVLNLMGEEWGKIVALLEGMLQEKTEPAAEAV